MENRKENLNLIVDTCVQCNSIITRFENQAPVCEVCRFLEDQMKAFKYPEYFVNDCQIVSYKN